MSYLKKVKEWEASKRAQKREPEPAQVVSLAAEAKKRGKAFPYPLPETLGLGSQDPLDIRYIDGKPVLDPGWWKKLPRNKK